MKVEEKKVARCLNSLCAINFGGFASDDDLTSLIEDHFLNDEADDEDAFHVAMSMAQ